MYFSRRDHRKISSKECGKSMTKLFKRAFYERLLGIGVDEMDPWAISRHEPKERKDAPLSEEAKAFIEKVFPCEPPCDSYGVCDNCCEKVVFQAGYNIGYRAALHSDHGRGDQDGPDDPDCICRGTDRQSECARFGCGFCRGTT